MNKTNNYLLKESLLIFIKNPKLGSVKTRLAQSIGKEAALRIYEALIQKTLSVARASSSQKILFFDTKKLDWGETSMLQKQNKDLGERMADAFLQVGNGSCIIIGSDCFELEKEVLDLGFQYLKQHPFCIGPAKDGGFYAFGVNFQLFNAPPEKVLSTLFFNKKWSHGHVATEMEHSIAKLGQTFATLPALSDIDAYEDLPQDLLNLL